MDDQVQGPLILSQSYLIGARHPGDTVLPVRVVLDNEGTIVVRCVGLRMGGHGCTEAWPMGHVYESGAVPNFEPVLRHLELFHNGT